MGNYKTKSYSKTVIENLSAIGAELTILQQDSKKPIRVIGQVSSLSTNAVKGVLKGHPANIATYEAVANALGSSLIEICAKLASEREAITGPGGVLEENSFPESTESDVDSEQERMDETPKQKGVLHSEQD